MTAVVKDIDPNQAGKDAARLFMDDFVLSLAVGEDMVEEVK